MVGQTLIELRFARTNADVMQLHLRLCPSERHGTLKRRPLVRFFACKEDLSNEPPNTPLPEQVINGKEPLMIVGAMAGG